MLLNQIADELTEQFRTLIEALPDVIYFKDGGGRWRVANNEGLRFFNLVGQPWEGKTDLELSALFPAMAEAFAVYHQGDEAAWTQGSRTETVERITNPVNGETATFEVTKIPLFHSDGTRRGLVIIGRDVTARKRMEETESRQRASLRHLSEIAAFSHHPLNEQFRQALTIGAAHLELEFGIVSHVQGEVYHVVSQVSPPGTLADGQTFPLGQTYCSITLKQADVVAIHDMENSCYMGHPCYQAFQLESYIGAPILVDGANYGTVNFSSPRAYHRPFDEGDKEFVHLLARWAGSAIERSRIEQRLAESELQLRTIIETEPECVKLLAANGTVLQMNRAGLNMLDAESPDQIIGKNALNLISPKHRKSFAALTKKVFKGESGKLEFEICSLAGVLRWLETNAVPLRNAQSEVVALLSVTRDITERKKTEEQIHQLAFFDTLTNLPNRRMLLDRLNKALDQAKRYQRSMALIFMDLDNFKKINDRLGHDVGDELLKEVAARLTACVRSGDTVSRQGGDEFVIVLTEITRPQDASTVADKILKALAKPISVGEHRLNITTSLGIAVYPINGTDIASELMKKADMAMYSAKEGGKNQYRFCNCPTGYTSTKCIDGARDSD